MNQWNTPERQALRESVTRFTEREIVPNIAQWEDDGELPRSLSKAAAAAGILGVGFSEAVGGEGGNAIDTDIVTEAIIEAGASSGELAPQFTHGNAAPHMLDTKNTNRTAASLNIDKEAHRERRA